MTEQPDLPPELLERVMISVKEIVANCPVYVREPVSNFAHSIALAVAPLLIEHGRELEKMESEKIGDPELYNPRLFDDAKKSIVEGKYACSGIPHKTPGNSRAQCSFCGVMAREWSHFSGFILGKCCFDLLFEVTHDVIRNFRPLRNEHRNKP